MEKVIEIVRIKQVYFETEYDFPAITSPDEVPEIACEFIGDEDREVFLVLGLNTKNRVNAVHRCHVGAINSSIVHPREVFKVAILNNCASIIVCHNHPSTDPSPSREDIEVTKRLIECGRILGIELLDHVIIGNKYKYISLKEKGYF